MPRVSAPPLISKRGFGADVRLAGAGSPRRSQEVPLGSRRWQAQAAWTHALCVVAPRLDHGDCSSALDGLTSAVSARHGRPGPCLSEGLGVAFLSSPFSAPAPGALSLPAGFELGSEPRGFSQGDLHGTRQLPARRA